MWRAPIVAATLLAGCGAGDETTAPTKDAGAGGCAAGTTEADGACRAAGVPPERCGAGFVADAEGGCAPTLPPAACPKGQMAVPGDAACVEPAPCGDPPWGDAPVDADTVFVDASAPAAGADGSAAHPFPTIAAAIQAAKKGALVALAAGKYFDVDVRDTSVRIWGRCPALVTIAKGAASQPATVFVEDGASGTRIHGVAITGPGIGLASSGSKDVVVDDVWIHDTGGYGFAARSVFGATEITLRHALVEGASGTGVITSGAEVTLDRVEIRGTRSDPFGAAGFGAFAEVDQAAPTLPSLTVGGSFVHGNRTVGIATDGGTLVVDSTVVRDMVLEEVDGDFGFCVAAQPTKKGLQPSDLTVTSSVLEGCLDVGVFVMGSNATVEATVVRDLQPGKLGTVGGRAFQVEALIDDPSKRSQLALRDSLVTRSIGFGLVIVDADATIERSAIRDTSASAGTPPFGDGLAAITGGAPTSVRLDHALVAGHPRAGLSIFGALATVAATRFECDAIAMDGEVQDGVGFEVQDEGGSTCGCAGSADVPCKVLTANLAPPDQP